jgi:hypothetical protein
MTEEALKFCRRLGEKGEDPRPLLAGFHTKMERSKHLRNARNLEKTAFKNVNVSADLTKKQRDEEKDMWKEAENRNENLSESDRSKKLQWLVVGAKGEKHLVKSTPREPVGGEKEWRGRRGTNRGGRIRGGTTRGSGTQRGRGSGTGRRSGANMVPMGPRSSTTPAPEQREMDQTETSETEESEEMEEDDSRVGERRKRKERNEDSGAVGPPVKR